MNQQAFERLLIDYASAVARAVRRLRQPTAAAAAGYASWGRRAVAVAIDLTCYTGYAFVGFLFLVEPLLKAFGGRKDLATQIVELLITVLFLVVPFALVSPWQLARKGKRNGQTFGKRIMHIRVVRDDGREWTFRTALWRQVVLKGILPLGSASLIGGIAEGVHTLSPTHATPIVVIIDGTAILGLFAFALWPFREPQRRGPHDLWAHSHVRRDDWQR